GLLFSPALNINHRNNERLALSRARNPNDHGMNRRIIKQESVWLSRFLQSPNYRAAFSFVLRFGCRYYLILFFHVPHGFKFIRAMLSLTNGLVIHFNIV